MTLFESLNMQEKIENELCKSMYEGSLEVARAAFNVTYFQQAHRVNKSVIDALYNECKELFGEIAELNDGKIFIDIPSTLRTERRAVVEYYSIYVGIGCYSESVVYSLQDCTTTPIGRFELADIDNETFKHGMKGKIQEKYITGLLKIADMARAYNSMFKAYRNNNG